MSLRYRIIQLKRNRFAKITIGTFIVLLLLLALYIRSESLQNSNESSYPSHSRFSNQVGTYTIFVPRHITRRLNHTAFRYRFTAIIPLAISNMRHQPTNQVPAKKVNLIMCRVTEKMKRCNPYPSMA